MDLGGTLRLRSGQALKSCPSTKPIMRPVLAKALFVDNSLTFSNDDELVCSNAWNTLGAAICPAHGQVGRGLGPKSEMESSVISRVEARLSKDLLHLLPLSIACDHSGADGAAIGLYPDEKYL